jgi:hypothetical protein
MRKNPLRNDTSGVNFVLEYVLTFMIASVLFSILLMMANGLFIQGPETTVSEVQYTDIGNDLTAKIIDTYLVAPVSPDQGNVSTEFDMPDTVAGNTYIVNVEPSTNSWDPWDKDVVVDSNSNDVSITVTLNGVNSTIPVTGNTSSSNLIHRIWYSS